MNKEDYVSLEVAKLLKEKGFDKICTFKILLEDDENTGYKKGVMVDRVVSFFKNIKNVVDLPTLYEAQKWLRNNHNIHIVIDNYACGYAWFLYKADNCTRISEYAEDGPNDGGCWDTYEEALNAGILEALKLI